MKIALNDVNILYINLERRPKRRIAIETEFVRLGLCGTLIQGIDGQTLDGKEYWLSRTNFNTLGKIQERILGRAGCYLSHLKALKYAIDNNMENVLILEDDVKFLTDSKNIVFDIPENSKLFYLGGLFWKKNKDIIIDDNDVININVPQFKLACAFSYIIKSKEDILDVYNTIINSTNKKAIDIMYINHFQQKRNCYVQHPPLCIQSAEFESDVTNYGSNTPKKPYNNEYFINNTYNNENTINYYNNYWKKYNIIQ